MRGKGRLHEEAALHRAVQLSLPCKVEGVALTKPMYLSFMLCIESKYFNQSESASKGKDFVDC